MFSTFSVHYLSITKDRFGRPATVGNLLYETCGILMYKITVAWPNLWSNFIHHWSILSASKLIMSVFIWGSVSLVLFIEFIAWLKKTLLQLGIVFNDHVVNLKFLKFLYWYSMLNWTAVFFFSLVHGLILKKSNL